MISTRIISVKYFHFLKKIWNESFQMQFFKHGIKSLLLKICIRILKTILEILLKKYVYKTLEK